MRKLFLLPLLLVVVLPGFGQSESVNDLIGQMQASFTKVETASFTYEHEIKVLEYSTLQYDYKQIDLKGVSSSYQNQFNLADIDPYAVRQETVKDIIYVVLTARNKQKLFKTVKNGKTEPFDDEVKIHAKNVDHARLILDLFKKASPIAEKMMTTKMKLEGYDNMVKWLEEHVGRVSDGVKSVEQSLQRQTFPGSFKLQQIESDGKSSKQEEFTFNANDINLNSLVFKVSGNSFGLEIGMLDRLKSVSLVRDGVKKPYEDEVIIYTNGVDEARDIRTVLTMMAPLVQAKVKSDLPDPKSTDDALEKLATFVKDVTIGSNTYSQSITPKCVTTFSVTEQSSSSTEKNTYTFNWMDINPNLAKLAVSGEKMTMELPALDKKKLVNHYKDDKVVGFENDAAIYVENVEVGRRLRVLVDKAINYCKTGYKPPFPSDTEGIINWMKSTIGEVTVDQTTVKQVLEPAEAGNLNKIKFTNIEIKSSSSVEEVFEFNLSDINPMSVDYQASGKWLRVKFETNFKNKIIKAYKAGKIMPYVYTLELVVKDTEEARGLIASLKTCAERLKEK